MSCECGCGFEGEDEVTQFLIEEASYITHDAMVAKEMERESAEPAPRPGEVRDPQLVDALEKAKELHRQRFGVEVR